MNKIFSKEFKIGALAIIGFALFYNGIQFLKGVDFLASNQVFFARLPSVNGLKEGSAVLVKGMTVGQVRSLKLAEDGTKGIDIELHIDKAVPIGNGTVANLTSSDLLGSKVIILEMGINTKMFAAGDTLPAKVEAPITEALTEAAKPLADKLTITTTKVNSSLDELSGTQKEVVITLRAFRLVAEQFSVMMSENRAYLSETSKNVSDLTHSLKETEKSTRQLVTKLSGFSDTLNKLQLSRLVNNASKAADNLNAVLVRMKNGEGTLGKLSKNDSLYRNLNNSAAALERLLNDVKAQPKKYVHFSLIGRK